MTCYVCDSTPDWMMTYLGFDGKVYTKPICISCGAEFAMKYYCNLKDLIRIEKGQQEE
jgi:hypothetical protein